MQKYFQYLPVSKPDLGENLVRVTNRLFRLLEKLDDNGSQPLRILRRCGFDLLSQETQLWMLYYEERNDENVFQRVVRLDKVNTMKALLPLTPLFAVNIEGLDNIWDWDLSWYPFPSLFERNRWPQQALYNNKVTWTVGQCLCSYESDNSDSPSLCESAKIARNKFAAQLFCYACKVSSTNCAAYLLDKCPQLITHYEDSSMHNPLAAAIEFDSPLLRKMIERGLPTYNIYYTMSTLPRCSETLCRSFMLKFDELAEGHEEEIRSLSLKENLPLLYQIVDGWSFVDSSAQMNELLQL